MRMCESSTGSPLLNLVVCFKDGTDHDVTDGFQFLIKYGWHRLHLCCVRHARLEVAEADVRSSTIGVVSNLDIGQQWRAYVVTPLKPHALCCACSVYTP